jgi:hypothetical protein
MRGSDVTLSLNGKNVIPPLTLPDLPAEGPIGLQHHGGRTPDGGSLMVDPVPLFELSPYRRREGCRDPVTRTC